MGGGPSEVGDGWVGRCVVVEGVEEGGEDGGGRHFAAWVVDGLGELMRGFYCCFLFGMGKPFWHY